MPVTGNVNGLAIMHDQSLVDVDELLARSRGASDTMLPCPFCGTTPNESQYQDESLWSHEIVTWHRVYCSNCDVGMSECQDYDALKLRWNHRT